MKNYELLEGEIINMMIVECSIFRKQVIKPHRSKLSIPEEDYSETILELYHKKEFLQAFEIDKTKIRRRQGLVRRNNLYVKEDKIEIEIRMKKNKYSRKYG
jgi:hypothetical protein